MNNLKIKLTRSERHGVTVIEVLTSMIVAAIGVAGVLVMIPFAAQQSTRGIEKDVADIVGRNAYEDLRIHGYTEVADSGAVPWFGASVPTTPDPPVAGTEPVPSGAVAPALGNALTPGIVHLDPHAVAAAFQARVDAGLPVAERNSGFPTAANLTPNPDFLSKYLPNNLKIPVATLNRASGALGLSGLQLSLAEARDLVQGKDDLEFGESDFRGISSDDPDLDGPQQFFNVSTGGNPLTRQYRGKYSWSALLVPQRNAADRSQLITVPSTPPTSFIPQSPAVEYKMYTLVYAERTVREADNLGGALAETSPDMLAAQVLRHDFNPFIDTTATPPTADRTANSGNPPLNGGYVKSVNRIVLSGTVAGVGKDDWVMLINKRMPPNYANLFPYTRKTDRSSGGVTFSFPFVVEDAGYDIQVAFCRVISVDQGLNLNPDVDMDFVDPGERTPTLSVQGGAFDFYYNDIELDTEIDAGTPDLSDISYVSDTWVVHLKGVVNVHERSISLD